MTFKSLLLSALVIACLIVGVGLGWNYWTTAPLPAQGEIEAEVYCCQDDGTCQGMKKSDCSTIFTVDRTACEARCAL